MVNQKESYTYSIGRRKTSVVGVRLFEGEGENTINNKKIEDVYKTETEKADIFFPLKVVEQIGNFHFTAMANGGGSKGQLGALRLAIARALIKHTPDFRPVLKKSMLLRRDPRMVERKKAGLKKARKAPQFSKR